MIYNLPRIKEIVQLLTDVAKFISTILKMMF